MIPMDVGGYISKAAVAFEVVLLVFGVLVAIVRNALRRTG